MPNTLLLGLGNNILGDDAVGLRCAAALGERLQGRPNIAVAQTTEMGLALLDFIEGFELLLIVDAVQTHQAPPGFIHEFDGNDLNSLPIVSPHFLGVGEALALGRQLGLTMPQRVRIFAIEVLDPFSVSAQMTPSLQAAFPEILDRLEAALQSLSRQGEQPHGGNLSTAN